MSNYDSLSDSDKINIISELIKYYTSSPDKGEVSMNKNNWNKLVELLTEKDNIMDLDITNELGKTISLQYHPYKSIPNLAYKAEILEHIDVLEVDSDTNQEVWIGRLTPDSVSCKYVDRNYSNSDTLPSIISNILETNHMYDEGKRLRAIEEQEEFNKFLYGK